MEIPGLGRSALRHPVASGAGTTTRSTAEEVVIEALAKRAAAAIAAGEVSTRSIVQEATDTLTARYRAERVLLWARTWFAVAMLTIAVAVSALALVPAEDWAALPEPADLIEVTHSWPWIAVMFAMAALLGAVVWQRRRRTDVRALPGAVAVPRRPRLRTTEVGGAPAPHVEGQDRAGR